MFNEFTSITLTVDISPVWKIATNSPVWVSPKIIIKVFKQFPRMLATFDMKYDFTIWTKQCCIFSLFLLLSICFWCNNISYFHELLMEQHSTMCIYSDWLFLVCLKSLGISFAAFASLHLFFIIFTLQPSQALTTTEPLFC